jgi:hypothetical protein
MAMGDSKTSSDASSAVERALLPKKFGRAAVFLVWFGGFVSAVFAGVVAEEITATSRLPTQKEEWRADDFAKEANAFATEMNGPYGNEGDIALLGSNAASLNGDANALADAIIQGRNDDVWAVMLKGTDGVGFGTRVNQYVGSIRRIDETVGGVDLTLLSQRQNRFSGYASVLIGAAKSDLDCLSKLANSPTPLGHRISDIYCEVRDGSYPTRFYRLDDKLDLLAKCEAATGRYLQALSARLVAEGEERRFHVNPSPWSFVRFLWARGQTLGEDAARGAVVSESDLASSCLRKTPLYDGQSPSVANASPSPLVQETASSQNHAGVHFDSNWLRISANPVQSRGARPLPAADSPGQIQPSKDKSASVIPLEAAPQPVTTSPVQRQPSDNEVAWKIADMWSYKMYGQHLSRPDSPPNSTDPSAPGPPPHAVKQDPDPYADDDN